MPFGKIYLNLSPSPYADGRPPPIAFSAARINVVVGPNDSGKSLFLKELSGISPRGERWKKNVSRKIVRSADWSDREVEEIRESLISQAFLPREQPDGEGGDSTGLGIHEIKSRDWTTLTDGVLAVTVRLSSLRDGLAGELLSMAGESLGELAQMFGQDAQLAISNSEDKSEFSRAVIVMAVLMLVESGRSKGGEFPRKKVIEAMSRCWDSCRESYATLGVDADGLPFEDLLNVGDILRAVMHFAAQIPLLQGLARGLPELPVADEKMARRYSRFLTLVQWFLDPKELEGLRAELIEGFARCSWANDDFRRDLAKKWLYLDGLTRLTMTDSAKMKPFESESVGQPPISLLHRSPEKCALLRSLVYEALGKHLVIDMTTSAPSIVWRLSDEEPPEGVETSYTNDSNAFFVKAGILDERSDGIHAYVGMLASIVSRAHEFVFVDEPEAFLHPPLVRKLARQLTQLASMFELQIFIATHSSDLVESFVSSGAELNVIRLAYDGGHGSARLIAPEDVRMLALDPLLRSEHIMSALFNDGAVICEGDADRVLYKEVNHRLLRGGEGVESCVFLNAQNWQTVWRMISPLREVGVAAAAVLDADVLFGGELKDLLRAARLPKRVKDAVLQARGGLRSDIAKRLKYSRLEDVSLKSELLAQLDREERDCLLDLLGILAEYGIFLAPVGELEDWFGPIGAKKSRNKNRWFRDALDLLGWDPEDSEYVSSGEGDVWGFLRDISAWIQNPKRKGVYC